MTICRCLVWATVLGVVASAAAADSSPKSAGDDRAARSAAMPDLHFQPYREQEPYRSSEFLNSSIEDKVMEAVYMGVNWFIGRIGKPFPHEDVLKRDALVGDPTALVESLKERYPQWISYDQWFLVVAGVCLVLAAVFTIVYLFYLCCRCCCCRKKYKSKNKADLKYDSCRRRSCNAFLAVLVVINIFAVAALFISCQYAHEGAQELPRRLTRSVDDLAVYKRDSGNRIRKLLVNDYEQMNATILEAIQDAASVLVDRIKKVTGAQALDELVGISEEAMDMQDSLVQFEQSLQSLDDDIKKLRNDFVRLRKTAEHELESCLQSTTDPFKEYCQKAKQMLDDHGDLPMDEVQDAGFAQTRKDLKAIAEYNISGLLHDARTKFSKLETSFQQEIGRKQNLVRDRLKEIGDELFQVAETISDRIKKVNFDELYHYISLHLETSDGYPVYKNYLWIAGLSVSGVMALMALAFGFGLFYGCCGKRPSYYEDDCCVRTTGSKLYCCGIALGIMVLFAMMVIGVVLFLAGANARSILCEPLDDPLRRPDAVALMERYLDVWKAKHGRDDVTLLLDEHNLTDIIRGCAQNRTLYDIFDLDKKYHLNDLKKQKEEAYRQLDEYLESMLRDLRVRDTIGDLITPEITNKLKKLNEGNITGIPLRLIRTIEDQIDKLDLLKNSQQLIDVDKLPEQRAVEVRRVLNDVRKLEEESATPLRRGLAQLVGNLTELNSRLPNLTERIPSLLIRLQHAEALLASNLTGHVEDASSEISAKLKSYVDGYLSHAEQTMRKEVSSCAPLRNIAFASKAAVCSEILDPINGYWASLLLCLLLTMPMIMLATSLRDLYANTEAYTDYIISQSMDTTPSHRRVSAFMTDTYDHTYRRLNGHSGKRGDQIYATGNYRTPSSTSTYFDDVGTVGNPPPPYTRAKRS